MPAVTTQQIRDALSQYQVPYLEDGSMSSKILKKIDIREGEVELTLVFGFPLLHKKETISADIRSCLLALPGVESVNVHISSKIESHTPQSNIKKQGAIKNIIAIGSGKGGVGKSTTTANLALALAAEGAKVGVLDADIYGPNQPKILGAKEKPDLTDEKKFIPVECYGVKSMSMGYLVDPNTPMVWRGPMVSSALQQLLNDSLWGELDYLFIDLPPGTGDIQLTMAKKIPVSGAVIVTTPQDVALLDARKALEMFNKVNIPVLGVIENMSTHVCRQCGHEEAIFGEGGGKKMADNCEVPMLGQLPLALSIRENADQGTPTVVAEPESTLAQRYTEIALRLAAGLSKQPKNYASLFPNIVVEKE